VTEPLEVVGAVIVHDGTLYCTQRGSGALAGKWEFPGGKLEAGESPEQALAREIGEELNCQVDVGDRIMTTRHEYSFATVVLTTYYCTLRSGQPALSEHQEDAWLPPDALTSLDWAPADIPAVHQIQRDLL
jgi:8-oxo-dGTP diphosphatase